jgi:hypothetical protein
MENKTDESLYEVHQMKEKNLEDFKASGFKSYTDYISSEMKKMGREQVYFIKEPTEKYRI